MPSADLVLPKRMSRVAVVTPQSCLRDTLVTLAAAGTVELVGSLPAPEGEEVEALRRLRRAVEGPAPEPALLERRPDVLALERSGEGLGIQRNLVLVADAQTSPHIHEIKRYAFPAKLLGQGG